MRFFGYFCSKKSPDFTKIVTNGYFTAILRVVTGANFSIFPHFSVVCKTDKRWRHLLKQANFTLFQFFQLVIFLIKNEHFWAKFRFSSLDPPIIDDLIR